VPSRKPYTKEMLREFNRLTIMASSLNQVRRIDGRLRTQEFVEKHGQAVCDEMFKVLMGRDEKKRRRKHAND
jgi:hypothetical protein